MNTLYPLLFEHNLRTTVWGGNRIKPMKGMPADNEPIGESWECSAVPGMESVVANGIFKGRKLNELVDMYGAMFMGERVYEQHGNKFPLLIKYIDAEKDLSIQVHPNDDLALTRHNSYGKTEMWYIMDAKPGAKLYAGMKSPISHYEYMKRIEDGSICDVLQSHAVKPGDVFFIPAGRVHAICAGIVLAEIQQSSNITYRIFDYNRPGLDGKPRELHTALAEDAIDYQVYEDYRSHYTPTLNKPVCLTECNLFTVKVLQVNRPFHRKLYKYDSFIVYMCLEGTCRIALRSWEGFKKSDTPCITEVTLTKGSSCLIPAGVADVDVIPDNEQTVTKLIETYIDNKNF